MKEVDTFQPRSNFDKLALKKIVGSSIAAVVFVFFAAVCLSIDRVPSEVQKNAAKSFANGADFHFWVTNKEPQVGKYILQFGMSVAIFSVDYMSKNQTNIPTYRLKSELSAKDKESGQMTKHTVIFPGDSSPPFKGRNVGAQNIQLLAQGSLLVGEGTAKVYMISGAEKADDTKPISNVLEVKVFFPGYPE